MKTLCLLVAALAVSSCADPVADFYTRVLPKGRASDFAVSLDESMEAGSFKVAAGKTSSGAISIVAADTTGATAGLGWYLTNIAKVQLRTWSGDNHALPTPLPPVQEDATVTRRHKWGYYQNVCTVSYTMVWWQWADWERELDWMALNGVNLPLAFTGQEYVWQKTFQEFGLTDEDLLPFFSGPAFYAWQRMGNLKGWGGPLPQLFIDAQAQLQKQILGRIGQLGMTPVLPAFAGHVPEALVKKMPSLNVTRSADWNGFNLTYGSVFYLEPSDPMFVTIGKTFIQKQREAYNTKSVFFNADQFNEMDPRSGDLGYLEKAGHSMIASMQAAEPNAVWVMQGWLFVNAEGFWSNARVKAYLSGVPNANMLILDLYSELRPQFTRLDAYYGKPFVWNMLHNFGGNTGLYGQMDDVNTQPQNEAVLSSTNITGYGLTMEGTRQNYVMYELMLQNIFRTEKHANMTEWVYAYARRRYGVSSPDVEAAWELLRTTVYSGTKALNFMGVTKSIAMLRPSLNLVRGGFMPTKVFYDPAIVVHAAKLLTAEGQKTPQLAQSETFTNDLVDVTRQALSNHLYFLNANHTAAYKAGDAAKVKAVGGEILSVLADLDTILGTSQFFLLGTWIANARAWGNGDATQAAYYEWNARNQLTLWGPKGEIHDYAGKEWSGLVSDFYTPRWTLFTSRVYEASAAGKAFDQSAFDTECIAQEQAWQHKTTPVFPATPTGNTVTEAARILAKYFS